MPRSIYHIHVSERERGRESARGREEEIPRGAIKHSASQLRSGYAEIYCSMRGSRQLFINTLPAGREREGRGRETEREGDSGGSCAATAAGRGQLELIDCGF